MENVFKVIYTKISNLEDKLNEAAGNLYNPNIINHINDPNNNEPMLMVVCVKAPTAPAMAPQSIVIPKGVPTSSNLLYLLPIDPDSS